MYFYSENYAQSSLSHGDQIRLDTWAGVDSHFITERNSRLHMVRYDYGSTTLSYDIVPADTLNDLNNLNARVDSIGLKSGSLILFDQITAKARPLGTFGGQNLEIKKGVISGTVE